MNEEIVEVLPGIRRFSDAALGEKIDKALANVEAGKTGAVIAYADLEGASLAVVAKLGDNWSVVGTLSRPWQGELEAEAIVRWSWAVG